MNTQTKKWEIHSTHLILLSAAALIGGSLLLGVLIQLKSPVQIIDSQLYQAIANGPHPAWLNALVKPFNFNFLPKLTFLPDAWSILPSYLYLMALGLLLYLFIKKRDLFPWAIITLLLGTAYVSVLFEITSEFVFRERPFLHLPNNLDTYALNAWKSWTSFPSGHARDTTLYATIIGHYIPKLRWVMWAFAIFIAFSRVYLGAHYPSDALAGLLIGYCAARISLLLTREIQILASRRQPQKHGDEPMRDLSRL